MRLIFLARKGEAETGSILQTEPNQQHRNMGLMVSGDFCSLGFCFGFAAYKKIQRLIFSYFFIKKKVWQIKTIRTSLRGRTHWDGY